MQSELRCVSASAGKPPQPLGLMRAEEAADFGVSLQGKCRVPFQDLHNVSTEHMPLFSTPSETRVRKCPTTAPCESMFTSSFSESKGKPCCKASCVWLPDCAKEARPGNGALCEEDAKGSSLAAKVLLNMADFVNVSVCLCLVVC